MSIIEDYTTVEVDNLQQSPALSFAVALCRKLDMTLKDDIILVDGDDIKTKWDACNSEVAWDTLDKEWIDPRFNVCENNQSKVSFSAVDRHFHMQVATGNSKAEAMNKAVVKSMTEEKIDVPTFLLEGED